MAPHRGELCGTHPGLEGNFRRVLLAGGIGNLIEWYDFGLYGLLAPILATAFFPGHNRMVQLLGVYGGFAAGFAMRPIGAVVLGSFGDRVGRRFVLVLSVALMGVSTVVVGLLPPYAVLGLWAPLLLIATRLFQGFSVGGEFVGSVTYLVEATPWRRGLTGSLANVGATAGMLLAAAAAALAVGWSGSSGLSGPLQPPTWAWRIPFLFGGVLAVAGYLLRRHLPEYRPAAGFPSRRQLHPLRQAMREAPRTVLAAILFTSGYGIVNYLAMVFLPTYAREFGHIAEAAALRINTAGQMLALLLVPLAGWFSDRFLRRRTLLLLAFLAVAGGAWHALTLAQAGGVRGFWLAQLGLAGLLAVVMGAAPAMLAEQFAPGYRVSAHAVAFNIGIGMAGGTAPMAAVALIRTTNDTMAPAVYLVVAALLSATGVLLLRDRSRGPMEEE